MNLHTTADMPGKSLPAELLVVDRDPSCFAHERLWRNSDVMQHSARGMGSTSSDILAMIQAGSTSLVPILAAQNPGTYYTTDANGRITVYSQPTGSVQNLPVGGGYPGGTVLTANTPLGNASAAGIDSSTLIMIAVVGLVAIMAMKGGR